MELCFVSLMFLSLGLKADAGSYLVLVPNNVQPGHDLTIPVKILEELTTPETITAQLLESTKDRDLVAQVEGQATAANPDILLKLAVPALSQYSYIVRVFGSGAFKFSNETNVYIRRKTFPVLVQTDKFLYKPGDTVKYRVFAISENLDRTDIIITVNIYDPKGHKIDEANAVSANPVFEGELPLSDHTFLGRWMIVVEPTVIAVRKSRKRETIVKNELKINNTQDVCDSKDKTKRQEKCYEKLLNLIKKNTEVETILVEAENITDKNVIKSAKTTYTFEVKEHVLPNFFVTLNVPSFAVIGDPFLYGTLSAKYPTNKPVTGYAEITISRKYFYGFYDPKAIRMSKTKITGEWDFSVPKDVLDRLERCSKHTTLTVQATVIEAITGIKQEATAVDVRFYDSRYKLEFHPSMSVNFMPGFNYDVKVKVTNQDGSPVGGLKGNMELTTTFFTEGPRLTNETVPNQIHFPGYEFDPPFEQGYTIMIKTMKYKIKEGVAYIRDLFVPEAAATGTIKAEFRGQCIYKTISRFRTLNHAFLRVEAVEAGVLAVGARIIFRLRFSVGSIDGNYLIISKGKIVDYGSFHIGSDMVVSVVVLLTRSMAPSARFVAYTVYKREVVADGIILAVDNMYENKVNVSFTPSGQVKPQTNVTLTVNADTDSLACILLQDSRVRQLGEDNDITRERVERALGNTGFSPIYRFGWGRIRPWSYNADDSYDKLKAAGLTPLTDADIHRYYLRARQPIAMRKKSERTIQAKGLIRKKFPPTWKWMCLLVGQSGEADIPTTVPDTITKWVGNAFAINSKTGFGVAPTLTSLSAFLNFFVSTVLPYSVIRGETFVMQANVFNYHSEDLQVLVTLRNVGQFQGVELEDDGTPTNVDGNITRCVQVKAESVTPVFFHIIPKVVGPMKINVRIEELKSRNIFDEIVKYLTIKAEGREMTRNIAFLISHQTNDTTDRSAEITYPTDTVEGSERIRIAIIGDLFGLTLKNIQRLLRMPYGCGEQNLVNFVPAIMAARYMVTTGRFNSDLLQKTRRILLTGYMRELIYQRTDGSFSAFGNADRAGSTWLTAFVMKSFAQAQSLSLTIQNLITIDPNVVDQGVRYIIDNQNQEGSFMEKGFVFHKRMQGGTAGSEAILAAFVTIALTEVKESNILEGRKTNNALDKAIALAKSYLNSTFLEPVPDYQAAITALANPEDTRFLSALEKSENKTTTHDGGIYWKNPSSPASQIETAAYALMVYARQNTKDSIKIGIRILKWLVQRTTPYGGFRSTQDTVVGLQAFEELAELIYSTDVDMRIEILALSNETLVVCKSFDLTEENHDVLQLQDLPGDVDSVKVEADGVGLALVEVQLFYNVKQEPVEPSYALTVESKDESLEGYNLNICTRYLNTNEISGMVLMSVAAITGYEPLTNGISGKFIKGVETNEEILSIYFEEIPSTEDVCVLVQFQYRFRASGVKQAPVRVYSYYETDKNAMKNYIPKILKDLKICSVCGEECGCGQNAVVLPMAIRRTCKRLEMEVFPVKRKHVFPGTTCSDTVTKTETGLLSYKHKHDSWNCGNSKMRFCTM